MTGRDLIRSYQRVLSLCLSCLERRRSKDPRGEVHPHSSLGVMRAAEDAAIQAAREIERRAADEKARNIVA